uniref:PP31 n=1 Tax=Phthorimaea operculella granulovirus TaxID=192584 RepID=A0A1B2CS27_9BBAC|nr:PP31 [Phthorimaea operculella granulovirus]QBH66017.1 PP31 [Phthorimaea operculella granulovirus]QBH66147.1 PP31 [Phthorimaea operculella granulovirus]QBH66277.1 PP31 [Phthorimaea operculella granulovirus]QBH66407.1 PP31 [Phthorimaea operculella granulovirus]
MDTKNEESRVYTINIEHVINRDTILDLFENPNFLQMLQNKTLTVSLNAQVDSVKKVLPKKKKAPVPYIINSFIFYTSFLSKADIKLKKFNKAWKIMGGGEEKSHEFRQLIESLEAFHKRLIVQESNGDMNKKATSELRKSVIHYAQNLLAASYKGEKITAPEGDETSKFYLACKQLYDAREQFQDKCEKFKQFLQQNKFFKEDEDDEERAAKRRKSVEKRRTENMVSDIIE